MGSLPSVERLWSENEATYTIFSLWEGLSSISHLISETFTASEDKLLVVLQIFERMCRRFHVKYEKLQQLLWLFITLNC